MKTLSAGLLNFLKTQPLSNRADLFAITPIPQNMLQFSQSLQTSPWAGSGTPGPPIATGNAVAAPDGSITATQLVFPATGGGQESYWNQSSLFVPIVGPSWTFSVWLRAASNLTTNLRLVQSTGQNDTIIPVSLTTTWTRFSMTITPTSVGTGAMLARLQQIASQPGITIFAWGAQLEMSANMGPYTATQSVPAGPFGPRPPSIYATSSQIDITYQGVVYSSSKSGAWERGKITSEAGFGLAGNDMSLTVLAPATIVYPNTGISFMAAAQLGLFDAALVQVFTAYWPLGQMPNPFVASWGVETKFAGFIKPNGVITRSKLEFEVADALYLLNQQMPKHLIQASCRHTLGDANCAIDLRLSTFNEINTVGGGSTRQNIVLGSAALRTASFYTQGYVTMLTGQNAGLSFQIKSQTGTASVLLASAMPLPLAVGDSFIMFAGCDKTQALCVSRFNNRIHYGGQDFVPNPEVAI